jgi:hypothetical protein
MGENRTVDTCGARCPYEGRDGIIIGHCPCEHYIPRPEIEKNCGNCRFKGEGLREGGECWKCGEPGGPPLAWKPRPEVETPYPLLRKWKDDQADEPDHDSEEGTLADSNTEVEKP